MNRSEAGKSEVNPRFCLFCGKEFPLTKKRGKFCNSSCSAKYNNRGVTRHIKGSRVCSCGKPKKVANTYCSDCATNHVYHRSTSVEDAKTDEARKRLLIDIRGYRCEECGLSEWREQPIPIELHHIDGDTDNNKEENLQLLCPNCHGLTDTHKRRNKNGKRQLMRRKRYSDGQTW